MQSKSKQGLQSLKPSELPEVFKRLGLEQSKSVDHYFNVKKIDNKFSAVTFDAKSISIYRESDGTNTLFVDLPSGLTVAFTATERKLSD